MTPGRTDVRICIANDDGTDLRSLTSSNPTNIVGILTVVGYGTARNILADLQKYSKPRGCPRVVALLVRVQVSKEHASDWTRQLHPKEGVQGRKGGLTDVLSRVEESRRTHEA